MTSRVVAALLAAICLWLPTHAARAQWFSGTGFAGAGLTGAGFSGAGSTFAAPIMAQWGRAFATQQGEGGAVVDGEGGLDYEPVGSLGGVVRVLNRAVEFGLTDVPMTPEEVARNGLVQFPLVMGGVAVVANLPGVATNTLRLSGDLLAAIYLGEVTRWNDPRLAAMNADIRLPDAPIVPIHREDGSGTTWHFATYLAAASPAWRQRVGVDTLLKWPAGRGAKGNDGVGSAVRDTPHAVGYVEVGLATRLGLSIARLQNAAGRFVAPTRESLQDGLASAALDPARHFHDPRGAPAGESAYPITATVYALMPQRPRSPARARRALSFFQLALSERADDATTLGYVPLPQPVVNQVIAYWRTSLGR
jgi:phosphate transport system substrate-binding protein